jgi:hypothetical protein
MKLRLAHFLSSLILAKLVSLGSLISARSGWSNRFHNQLIQPTVSRHPDGSLEIWSQLRWGLEPYHLFRYYLWYNIFVQFETGLLSVEVQPILANAITASSVGNLKLIQYGRCI